MYMRYSLPHFLLVSSLHILPVLVSPPTSQCPQFTENESWASTSALFAFEWLMPKFVFFCSLVTLVQRQTYRGSFKASDTEHHTFYRVRFRKMTPGRAWVTDGLALSPTIEEHTFPGVDKDPPNSCIWVIPLTFRLTPVGEHYRIARNPGQTDKWSFLQKAHCRWHSKQIKAALFGRVHWCSMLLLLFPPPLFSIWCRPALAKIAVERPHAFRMQSISHTKLYMLSTNW